MPDDDKRRDDEPYDPRQVVLVVEDDPLVRMLATDILDEAGFEVLEAQNADDALTILRLHEDVRLLFSDVDMPGSMNGLELARQVHRLWPPIRLLLTSGRHQLTADALPDDGQFVGKPWSQDALITKVRSILAV